MVKHLKLPWRVHFHFTEMNGSLCVNDWTYLKWGQSEYTLYEYGQIMDLQCFSVSVLSQSVECIKQTNKRTNEIK